MQYTRIPTSTFQEIQLNAGILVDSFNPSTGEIGNLLGATTGGVNFADSIEYSDFGEDIDNCPKNTMELKKLMSHEVKINGTFITMSLETAKTLAAAADVDVSDATHIIPRNDLLITDFVEVWWIGDYSDKNTGVEAGFIAIRMRNALNTAGFQIKSSDKAKGQFVFEFTGHYSINAQDVVPYDIYIKKGEGEGGGVTIYSVVQNLTNVTSSYAQETAISGSALNIELSVETGYVLLDVKVDMGGVDITATAYDNNNNISWIIVFI